jgi:acyl CoA:acetate/3-ketoacid CoA transferase
MSKPDSLTALLRRWQHAPTQSPEFANAVWARIEASRRDERAVIAFRWALPLAASVALFLGVGVARLEAKRVHAEKMADFYVRTIDPVQIVAHDAHK